MPPTRKQSDLTPRPRRRLSRPVPQPNPARLVPLLLDWFPPSARDLPWRRTRDPYAVWVSEIMLQQTQVRTVVPYWNRWMRELPTLRALANAGPDRIHKLWEGLGYYSRVRNMQRAAKVIIEKHNGTFPESFDAMLKLPGIGRYTAGAICSIAFGQPRPALDGNVVRVLARVFGIKGNVRDRQTNALLWRLAEDLVQHACRSTDAAPGIIGPERGSANRSCNHSACTIRGSQADRRSLSQRVTDPRSRYTAPPASLVNQSLMELGALICAPRRPQCERCPLAGACVAKRTGGVEDLPNLGSRIRSTARQFVAFVLKKNGRFLVRQRPPRVVNAHLWEFPNVECGFSAIELQSAAHSTLGFTPQRFAPVCVIKHSITRYRISLRAFAVNGARVPGGMAGRWLTRAELEKLSFPSAHRKILSHL